jgi:hypothetical protein
MWMDRHAASAFLAYVLSCIAAGAEAQDTWTLSDHPTLSIGVSDGPPGLVFHDIRGVMTIDDSLIVVADGGSKELRTFTMSGTLVRTFGSPGSGPGEFGAISWAETCGSSSVVVYDYARARVTKWSPEGTLLDGFGVESTEPGIPPYTLSCGRSTDFAVVGWSAMARVPPGPYRRDVKIGILGPDGRLREVLGTFPGPERYRYSSSDGPRPFGKETIARMAPEGVFVSTGDSYRIDLFGREGGRRAVIESPRSQVELTRAMVASWQDSILSRVPAQRRGSTRQALENYDLPAFLPAYSDFRLDPTGQLWVALFPPPDQRWVDWDVFTASAIHIATIRIPRWFRPMEFGGNHLLGVSTDSLGVQQIQRFQILR